MKAHLWCSWKRSLIVLGCIWPLAFLCGLPTLIFVSVHDVSSGGNENQEMRCIRIFGQDRVTHQRNILIFQYIEFVVFYLVPLLTQIILYVIIGKTLFFNSRSLYETSTNRSANTLTATSCRTLATTRRRQQATNNETHSALRARKQVVKMLIACVSTYFICYSPVAVPVIHSTFTSTPFRKNHVFDVVVLTMAYANSALNPILYSVFSRRFRAKFRKALTCQYFSDPSSRQAMMEHHRHHQFQTMTKMVSRDVIDPVQSRSAGNESVPLPQAM